MTSSRCFLIGRHLLAIVGLEVTYALECSEVWEEVEVPVGLAAQWSVAQVRQLPVRGGDHEWSAFQTRVQRVTSSL